MKNILYLLLIVFLASCQDETPSFEKRTDSKEGVKLYIRKAVDGRQLLQIFPQNESRKFTFTVNYGGLGLPANDIKVTFAENTLALDSINKVRVTLGQTPYLKFPEGSYTLDKAQAVIKAGEINSDLITVTYDSKKFDLDKSYMLVLQAQNGEGYKFSTSGQQIMLLAAVEERELTNVGWSASASSEQKEWETTGLASALIDNNINTYWHSQWSPEDPELIYPHWVIIDFPKETFLTKIGLTRRQNNDRGFKDFVVEGSIDGKEWMPITNKLEMERSELAVQVFVLKEGYYKRVRLRMLTAFEEDSASTHLAEVSFWGY